MARYASEESPPRITDQRHKLCFFERCSLSVCVASKVSHSFSKIEGRQLVPFFFLFRFTGPEANREESRNRKHISYNYSLAQKEPFWCLIFLGETIKSNEWLVRGWGLLLVTVQYVLRMYQYDSHGSLQLDKDVREMGQRGSFSPQSLRGCAK